MQNVHEYLRGIAPGSLTYIRTAGSGRDDRGGKTDQISAGFLYRGQAKSTLTKSLDAVNQLLRPGSQHPARKDFYIVGLGSWSVVPGWEAVHILGAVNYEGLLDATNRPVVEELGWYYNERFWPKAAGSAPTLLNVPGRPGNVYPVSVLEFQKSVQRSYVAKTLPGTPAYNADGTMTVPWTSGGAPDLNMESYSWLGASNATYNVPHGPYLANRQVRYLRLSTGTPVPIYEITEQWLSRPALTPNNS